MQDRCSPFENILDLVHAEHHEMKRGFRQDTFGTLKFQNDLIMNFNDLLNGEIRHDIFYLCPESMQSFRSELSGCQLTSLPWQQEPERMDKIPVVRGTSSRGCTHPGPLRASFDTYASARIHFMQKNPHFVQG